MSESISVCSVICFSFPVIEQNAIDVGVYFFNNFILNTYICGLLGGRVVRPRNVDSGNYDGFVNWNSAPASARLNQFPFRLQAMGSIYAGGGRNNSRNNIILY